MSETPLAPPAACTHNPRPPFDLPDPKRQPTLRVEDAARLLGIGRVSAYKAIEAGEIPSIRLGSRIKVPTAALLAMLGLPSSGDAA